MERKTASSCYYPSVTVIVCTRNRRHNAVFVAQSILASNYPNFTLFIMDQSDDDTTQQVLAPLLRRDERLHSIKMTIPGKATALNLARQQVLGESEIVALTDDDCTVDANWLSNLVSAFESNAKIGCVMGEVVPAVHDPAEGYISFCHVEKTHTIYRLREFLNPFDGSNSGMGANLAVRSEVLTQIGGWDPCIGPGTKFGSGDDHDLAVRVLLAGYGVHFCAEAKVTHYGFRVWEQSKTDLKRWGEGAGATFIKYLRCGVFYSGGFRRLSETLYSAMQNGLRGRRPLGLTFPIHWFRGVLAGSRHPINRSSHMFQPLDGKTIHAYRDNFSVVVLRDPGELDVITEVPRQKHL